jgi:polysaccharide biosynthesis transport protein
MKNFQDLTIHDYLGIVRRRLWYLVIPAVLVSLGSAIYVWRLPSIYKSETSILVSERILPEDYIGSLVRQSVIDRLEFAKQQLRSRTFVERIAQEFQLVGNGANTEGGLNAVINSTEILVVPPNVLKLAFYASDPNTAQAVTRRLAERVMQSNNAARQEKVDVADQFLEEQVRAAADDLTQAEQKLRDFNQKHFPGVPESVSSDTLSALQSQLAAAESDLQSAIEQRKAYERSLAEHKNLKLAVDTPRPTPSSTPRSTAPTGSPTSALQLTLAQKKAELASLLTRYTPEHPDVARVAREIRDLAAQMGNTTPAANPPVAASAATGAETEVRPLPEIDMTVDFYQAEVRRELDQLNREIVGKEARKRDLSNRVSGYLRRINMPPDVMQELTALTQQREGAKDRYNVLANKKLSSELAGKVDTDSNNKMFTTIDPPNLPQIPVRPDRLRLTVVGCLAGLMLGVGLVMAREILDPTLTDEDSAAAELKLPVLTSIPMVGGFDVEESKGLYRWRRKGRADVKANALSLSLARQETIPGSTLSLQLVDKRVRDVILGSFTLAGEQYQIMRAELLSEKQRRLKSLIVTSAVPGEGKTFVSCCLAGILAKEQGKKVLLIDGDLRTGSAGRVMGVGNRGSLPGLYEVLTGAADVENCLVAYDELNLFLLPAGRVVDNPVELLSSPRLLQVMQDLALLFDWIIVDAPPVVPIADTHLLVPVCDAAIIVVRADKTASTLVKEAINKVGREKISGTVLNGVRNVKSSHYYGHYYNRLAQSQK